MRERFRSRRIPTFSALCILRARCPTALTRAPTLPYRPACDVVSDAGSPFVGTYPFRTSEKGATLKAGLVTREAKAEQAVAADLAAHFVVPEVAAQDPMVAQGLQFPQR